MISAARSLWGLLSSNHHLIITAILQIFDSLVEVDLLFVPFRFSSDHPINASHLVIISLDLSSDFVDSCLLFLIVGSFLKDISHDSSGLRSGISISDIDLNSWVWLIVVVGSQGWLYHSFVFFEMAGYWGWTLNCTLGRLLLFWLFGSFFWGRIFKFLIHGWAIRGESVQIFFSKLLSNWFFAFIEGNFLSESLLVVNVLIFFIVDVHLLCKLLRIRFLWNSWNHFLNYFGYSLLFLIRRKLQIVWWCRNFSLLKSIWLESDTSMFPLLELESRCSIDESQDCGILNHFRHF